MVFVMCLSRAEKRNSVTTTTPRRRNDAPVYDRVVKMIFHGRYAPGDKLVEEQLATELGVSRVPIRETLSKLVGQGLLVGGNRGQGVRMRRYGMEEVRQLYEYREPLEGVAAAAAARRATSTDLTQMEMICDQAQGEIDTLSPERWPDLDYHFHMALAEASHNERIIGQMKLLLTECRYLFFIHPHPSQRKATLEEGVAQLRDSHEDHMQLLELVRSQAPEEAERKERADMRKSADRFARLIVTGRLASEET